MKARISGFTLVEVVIAMLLTAVIVSAVFSLALTIGAGNVMTSQQMNADQYARQLTSILKSYVTADCSGTPIDGIYAPNKSAAFPNGSWSLAALPDPSDPAKYVSDSCNGGAPGCYALSPGTHVLTHFLPDPFEAAPYGARAQYVVAYSGWASANPPCLTQSPAAPPSISVSVNWTQPSP